MKTIQELCCVSVKKNDRKYERLILGGLENSGISEKRVVYKCFSAILNIWDWESSLLNLKLVYKAALLTNPKYI